MWAPPLAPFLERPAAERDGCERGHTPPGKRRRAVTENRALRAAIAAGDPASEPCPRELAEHSHLLIRFRRSGSTFRAWGMFPTGHRKIRQVLVGEMRQFVLS
jgi:hypothetical protein